MSKEFKCYSQKVFPGTSRQKVFPGALKLKEHMKTTIFYFIPTVHVHPELTKNIYIFIELIFLGNN